MKKENANEIADGKIFAMLSYLSIFCIIPLIYKKDNNFVLSHGKQGLVLFIAEFAILIIHFVLGIWIFRLGMFFMLLMSFFGMIAALKGQLIELPFVHEIADQIEL